MITASIPQLDPDRVILSGRLSSGKDYIAEKNGYTVYGFADPMYKIAEHFLGTSDKGAEGVRRFEQKVGAWGRGEVNEEYPLTLERKRIRDALQNRGHKITGMGSRSLWQHFGFGNEYIDCGNPAFFQSGAGGFWIELLGDRIGQASEEKIAITNGRFPNELRYFISNHRFKHFHVMCSEETRRERLEEKNETYDPDAETDITEQLAAELDYLALQPEDTADVGDRFDDPLITDDDQIGSTVQGVKFLHTVVWNDTDENLPDELSEKIDRLDKNIEHHND